MRIVVIVITVLAGLSVGAGCSNSKPANETSTPVIVQLELPDHKITVLGGDDGRRYQVHTHDGRLVADQLSVAEFEASFPTLFELYQESIANLDARIDL